MSACLRLSSHQESSLIPEGELLWTKEAPWNRCSSCSFHLHLNFQSAAQIPPLMVDSSPRIGPIIASLPRMPAECTWILLNPMFMSHLSNLEINDSSEQELKRPHHLPSERRA